MRTGCDADGRLLAQQVDVLADAGAYASLGPGVLETALEHACGPYVVPNVRTSGRLAYTNNGVCGAFRGFGANQMAFAVECQMDRLAAGQRHRHRSRYAAATAQAGHAGLSRPDGRAIGAAVPRCCRPPTADPIWAQAARPVARTAPR